MASEWFYTRDGKTKSGPFSSSQLQALAKSGQLLPTDMVWKEGMAKWTPASNIKGLFYLAADAVTLKKPSATTARNADKEQPKARITTGNNKSSRTSAERPEQSGRPGGKGKVVLALVALAAVACVAGLAVLGVVLLNPDLLEKTFGGNKEKSPAVQVAEGPKKEPKEQPKEEGAGKKEGPKDQSQDKGTDKKEDGREAKKDGPKEQPKDDVTAKKEPKEQPKDEVTAKKDDPSEQPKLKEEKLTQDYLPLKPGTKTVFKVVSFGQAKEQISFFEYEHMADGKIHLNKLKSTGSPDSSESLVKDKTVFTYEYRLKGELVELGLALPKRAIWWQPKIKSNSSPGTTWEREMPSDGFPGTTVYRHTLIRFEQFRTTNELVPCAILMEEMISEITPASTTFREVLSIEFVAFAKGMGMVRKDIYTKDTKSGQAVLSQRWALADAKVAPLLDTIQLPVAMDRQFVKTSKQEKPQPQPCFFCRGTGIHLLCDGTGVFRDKKCNCAFTRSDGVLVQPDLEKLCR